MNPLVLQPTKLEYRLYLINACVAAAKGMFVVVLAWLTLEVSQRLQSVGLVMATWSGVSFIAGPIVGVYIDRIEKRFALVIGQCLVSVSVLLPFLSTLWDGPSMQILYLTGLIWGAANLFVVGPLDALLQGISDGKRRRKLGQKASSIRQMGLVLGAGAAGLVIDFLGVGGALLVTALLAAVPTILVVAFPSSRIRSGSRGVGQYFHELQEGMIYCIDHSGLLSAICIIVVSFSVGQLTNAILVSFVVDDLAAGSRVFGWMDAGWSLGAFAVALTITSTSILRSNKQLELLALSLLGVLTVIFSQANSVAMALVLHVMMGGAYSVARIRSDASLVELCHTDLMGRVRSNIQAIIGLVGILTYLSPTVFNIETARWLYLVWGVLVCLFAALLFLIKSKKGVVREGR